MLRQEDFSGRRQDEEILVFARRHGFFLFRSILVPLTLFTLAVSISVQTGVLSTLITPLGFWGIPSVCLAVLLLSFGLGLWAFLEWENDHYIVTTERIISIRRIIKVYEERREAEVERVQDVTAKTPGLTGSILGYADLRISTAGALGVITFSRVSEAAQIAEIVLRQREAASRKRLDTTRETVRETLQREMGIS